MLRERRARGEKPTSAWLELEPLKNIQVWRFSLYYFFVFGAFVALALWLPRYLIGVYGLDITTAGMIGGDVLVPGQRVPRLWRPSVRPLRRAARDVLDVPRLGRLHLHAVLSADRLRRAAASTARSPSTWRWALVPFTVTVFVLGFFMASARPRSTSTSRSTTRTMSARSAAWSA